MTKSISIFEVGRRLAEMAAADGVISAAERQLLKEFAEDNGVDGGRLIRMAYAMAGKVELPEVAQVGPAEMKGSFDEMCGLCYLCFLCGLCNVCGLWVLCVVVYVLWFMLFMWFMYLMRNMFKFRVL